MTTREITGTVVGVRAHREDSVRMFGALLGAQVRTLTVRCAGVKLPLLAQMYDPGSLRQARTLRVIDCTISPGTRGWIVRTEGDVAEVLTSHQAKDGDLVTIACDPDAQPRTIPVGR